MRKANARKVSIEIHLSSGKELKMPMSEFIELKEFFNWVYVVDGPTGEPLLAANNAEFWNKITDEDVIIGFKPKPPATKLDRPSGFFDLLEEA